MTPEFWAWLLFGIGQWCLGWLSGFLYAEHRSDKRPRWERRYDRKAARRYAHQTPWRSCNRTMRGFCLRCFWRDVTGINKRAKAADIERRRRFRDVPGLLRVPMQRNADGAWRPVEEKR